METFLQFLNYMTHLDHHLNELASGLGLWSYAVLFATVFSETGFVVTAFLPGETLVAASGALSAGGGYLNPIFLFMTFAFAAMFGDALNFTIGSWIGHKFISPEFPRIFKKEHIEIVHKFFEKFGGRAVFIGRFIPCLKTLVPFVSAATGMKFSRFVLFNAPAAVCWSAFYVFGGYFFGSLEFVQNNFAWVIAGIVLIAAIPAVMGIARHRLAEADHTADNK